MMAENRKVTVISEVNNEVFKFVAEMYDDKHPELCNEIWKHLPFDSQWVHAMVSGGVIYGPAPIIGIGLAESSYKTTWSQAPIGTMSFSPWFHDLSVKYGQCTETLTVAPWGIVVEGIDTLKRLGNLVWNSNVYTKEIVKVKYLKGADA